jgi:hypothetical protein
MKWLAFAWVLTGCTADTFTGADGAAPTDGSSGDVVVVADVGTLDASCTPTSIACAANAQCNSFDDGPTSLPPWSDISEYGGQVSFESDQAVTCPDGLVANVPVATANQPPRAAIAGSAQITGIATAHASLELDVIFPKAPTGGATFLFMYPNTDSQNGIGIVWSNGWYVRDSLTDDQIQIDPRTDAWNHVKLDILFAQSGGTGVIEFDYTDSNGTLQKPKLSKSTLGGAIPAITAITFGIGITPFGATTAPMKLFIDDVVFSPF